LGSSFAGRGWQTADGVNVRLYPGTEWNHSYRLFPNYNMKPAFTIISGLDVWLNTPLRLFEASGTRDAESLYQKLDNMVLPLYHNDRASWINLVKEVVCKSASLLCILQ